MRGAGIVDVYPEVQVRYEDCLIEQDTWRGGVEFHSGRFQMENCVIRGNPGSSFLVTKGARAELTNCLIEGKGVGVRVGENSELLMRRCTVRSGGVALEAVFGPDSSLEVERCLLKGEPCALQLTQTLRKGDTQFDLRDRLTWRNASLDGSGARLVRKVETPEGWKVEEESFDSEHEERMWEVIGFKNGAGSGPLGVDEALLPFEAR